MLKTLLGVVTRHIKTTNKKIDQLLKFKEENENSVSDEVHFETIMKCKELSSNTSSLVGLLQEFLNSHSGIGVN